MKKAYFNWSSGKDASLALYLIQKDKTLHVDKLVTTVNAHYDRVTMHGLRRSLLEAQAKAIGLPLDTIELPENPSMEQYEKLMSEKVNRLQTSGYSHCGFGDIFLQDLRDYREKQLQGITCHFPLWKRDTTELIHEFITLGFKAIIVCVNGNLLNKSFVGRVIDDDFLEDLPDHVDPCGETGEFHTFCYAGPLFSKPVSFVKGEKTERHYPNPDDPEELVSYWFIDLIPFE